MCKLCLAGFDFYLSIRYRIIFPMPVIFWLSNLVAVYSRASGTIMDSNSHVCSHLYASHAGGTLNQSLNVLLELKVMFQVRAESVDLEVVRFKSGTKGRVT
jgi:hypothetical protein